MPKSTATPNRYGGLQQHGARDLHRQIRHVRRIGQVVLRRGNDFRIRPVGMSSSWQTRTAVIGSPESDDSWVRMSMLTRLFVSSTVAVTSASDGLPRNERIILFRVPQPPPTTPLSRHSPAACRPLPPPPSGAARTRRRSHHELLAGERGADTGAIWIMIPVDILHSPGPLRHSSRFGEIDVDEFHGIDQRVAAGDHAPARYAWKASALMRASH